MRRHLLVLTLLAALPVEAKANPAFCTALREVVSAAQARFDWLPAGRAFPGSVEEWRGVSMSQGGQPHGVVHAVMFRQDVRREPNPVRARFDELQREIGTCLADASPRGVNDVPGGAEASWQMPYAIIGLRRVDGGGNVAQSMVEVSVASRW